LELGVKIVGTGNRRGGVDKTPMYGLAMAAGPEKRRPPWKKDRGCERRAGEKKKQGQEFKIDGEESIEAM